MNKGQHSYTRCCSTGGHLRKVVVTDTLVHRIVFLFAKEKVDVLPLKYGRIITFQLEPDEMQAGCSDASQGHSILRTFDLLSVIIRPVDKKTEFYSSGNLAQTQFPPELYY